MSPAAISSARASRSWAEENERSLPAVESE